MRVKLVERTTRGIHLTSAGEVLLHHAQEVMLQSGRLDADIDAVRGVRRGHVIVRTIESFATSLLPAVLAGYCARYPAVTLDISVSRSTNILEAVRSGTCQIGITFCPAPDPRVASLGSMVEPQQVIMAPGHPLASSERLRLAELRDYPIVAPAMHGSSRVLFDAAWQAEKLTCRPTIETNSMHVAAGFLRAGQAVAIASASRAQPYLAMGQLVAVPVTSSVLARGKIDILVRRGQRLPPAAEALARALARCLALAS